MEHIHRVAHPLSNFVEFLWLSEGYTQIHKAERVLPTGSVDLVIDLDAHHEIGGIYPVPVLEVSCWILQSR